ncbi:MAG: oligoendopeptidase F [Anaerolineae bacterium]|jgi:oligoendopeptidase F|nr:oligoendopeptidase F [Chloroflexota bacterium]
MTTVHLRRRDQVPAEDRWNVASIYATDEAWEQALAAAGDLPERVASYEGHLGESQEVLAEALEAYFGANREMEKIYVYAHLRADEDLGNSHYQQMVDRARSAYIALSAATAYLAPEILTIPDERISSWIAAGPASTYRVWLQELLRGKPHTLSPAEERILAMASEPLSTFSQVFGVLKNVDLSARLPEAPSDDGSVDQLTHASFITRLESRNREVRRQAFEGYYREFKGNRNTIVTTMSGAVKTHVFNARVRNFGSAIEASLFDDHVEVAVYDALIAAMHNALPVFYRYMDLRRRLLGLDKLHMYDIYVPAVPEVSLKYTFDEAADIVCQALAPLGQDYVSTLRQGIDGGWMDRYENVGKHSGAYSSGCYDTQPFILLNFTGTLDAVFTMAHELGHSMHSWLSNHSQPYHQADYPILLAEVASTTNEALLNRYLLNTIDDRNVRAYLIDRYLDGFRGTMFRQTMFAEFEKAMHGSVEAGQPMTADGLDALYYGLVKEYYGDSVAFDEQDAPIAWEWARIDHFFYNFYVYKYATGMASAVAIERAISEGQPGALERYLTFLKAGGSAEPLQTLKGAGVDLTTPVPVAAALSEFERLLGELEALMS